MNINCALIITLVSLSRSPSLLFVCVCVCVCCVCLFNVSGYSVGGDLELLARSWPFVAEVLSSAVRIVDIKTLAAMVS